ncbi:MAG: vitamin B12-dependent ribonucleotide reductase, partial [Myxococcaceae bacterium]
MEKELGGKTVVGGKERRGVKVKGKAAATPAMTTGLSVERFFTTPGVDPADELAWELRSASIKGEDGKVVFDQKDIEVPKSWSMLATNVVASKYFRGTPGTPDRETSVRKLVARVVDTLTAWGEQGHYFATAVDREAFHAELTHLLLRQKAAFNSPVWFNVGVEAHPQCSACFINSVDDNMESILGLARTEGMLFKYGSGTGTNLSTVRGSKELLAGGGTASGPVSFMRGFDDFMKAVVNDGPWQTRAVRDGQVMETYKARELFREIAEAAHLCGDPGLQYDTTVNAWHTCSGTARINASNPCSEYMFLDDSAC